MFRDARLLAGVDFQIFLQAVARAALPIQRHHGAEQPPPFLIGPLLVQHQIDPGRQPRQQIARRQPRIEIVVNVIDAIFDRFPEALEQHQEAAHEFILFGV